MRCPGYSTRKYYGGRRSRFPTSGTAHPSMRGGANDVMAMSHWIIRRDRAETALAQLGLKNADVDFLAVADANGDAVPVINFRTADDEDPPWAARAVRLLAMVALLASVAGFTIFEWRQATVAAAIDASLADARQGAQSGRDGTDPAGPAGCDEGRCQRSRSLGRTLAHPSRSYFPDGIAHGRRQGDTVRDFQPMPRGWCGPSTNRRCSPVRR